VIRRMHLAKSHILSGLIGVALLVPNCYTSPAAFPSKHSSNVFDTILSNSRVESSRSSSTELRRSNVELLAPRVLPNSEDDRSRSLMPLSPRDISLLKETLRVIWNHFLPFAASRQGIAAMTAFFSAIPEPLKTWSLQTAKQALSITYGGLKLTFRSAGVIAWTVIEEFLQSMIEKLKAGLAGFFEVQITGPNGVVAFVIVTLIATVFSKINNAPGAIGGGNPNPHIPWDPTWLG